MARNLTTQDVSWFLDLYDKGQLNLDPPYQRRSVWSPRDRRFFIDTILNNFPAPPVFLHKTLDDQGRATYHVVDGKQRLLTIIQFTQGKVRIPDDFADVNLQKKQWNDLERSNREKFWNYYLIVEMLPDVSDAAVRNIFDRINRNARKLMPQEMRHAKYDGWFITTAEAEAEKQEWKDFGVSTAARIKRMADVQFVSELFMLLIHHKIEGFDQDSLDDIYAGYEDISDQSTFVEDDFFDEVERIKAYVRDALNINSDLRNYTRVQSHFYSLWGYIALERSRLLPVEEFVSKYTSFLTDVTAAIRAESLEESAESPTPYRQAVIKYAANARGASTDLTPRTERYNALILALHGTPVATHEDH
ncbi:MAG: DUF262 domain-containing protein [Candidatus Binatus sp.]|uniref:DUF262 domain-containing protein n=1 Tax=Candidatus Binatus sp. TaxID=2811406 RepID=UPI003C75E31E